MKSLDNRPIGIFDSGLGGLTVAAAIRKRLPDESIIYLGDTARVPYGDKSPEAIRRYAREDVEFLRSQGVKLIIVACNTVSAVALPTLRHAHPGEKMLGVIDSGAEAVLAAAPERVCVIGTRATINSDAYRKAIHAGNPAVVVESIACPLLVPFAEEGVLSGPLLKGVLDIYLGKLQNDPPDALLLGCTHYPLFRAALDEFFGGRVRIIDSAVACAEHVAVMLEREISPASPRNNGAGRFFVTDMPSAFGSHAARFLGGAPERVECVKLTE
ncbi:MAG: glutamate racemase [Victivallaceae bacterium]|nr:glutamate racemase [Victivallaceae bacterium]